MNQISPKDLLPSLDSAFKWGIVHFILSSFINVFTNSASIGFLPWMRHSEDVSMSNLVVLNIVFCVGNDTLRLNAFDYWLDESVAKEWVLA